MNKILITGANGYIGSHVVRSALELCPHSHVIALDFNNSNIDSHAEYCSIDILKESNKTDLFDQLGRPDVCIHLAWKDGFNHNAGSHLDNLSNHFCFLKNMIDSGCQNISVMGTMHEIGFWEGEINEETPCNPLSLYGISKNALRQAIMSYVKNKQISMKWLRAYYITGNDKLNNSVFAKILQMASEGKKTFPFTTGLNKYDFIDVQELATLIVLASVQNKINGIINVCSGEAISLKDKVELFIKEKKLDIRPEYGTFPAREYDSKECWGNTDKIKLIKRNHPNLEKEYEK